MHRPVNYRPYYPSFGHQSLQGYPNPAFDPFSPSDQYPTPGPTPTSANHPASSVQFPSSYPYQNHYQSQDAVPIPVIPSMLPSVLPVPARKYAETRVAVPPSVERVKGSARASTSSDAKSDIQTVPSSSAPTQRKESETKNLPEKSAQPEAGPKLWKREVRQGMEMLRTALEGCLPPEQINASTPNYKVAALGARLIKQQKEELRQTKEELHQVREELRILDDSLDHAWTQVKHLRDHASNLENHLESQARHLDTRVRDGLIRNNHLREELEILETRLRKYQRRQAKGLDEAEVAEVDMSDDQSLHES